MATLILIWSHPDLATLILIWSHPDLVTLILGKTQHATSLPFPLPLFPLELMEARALSLRSSLLFASSSTSVELRPIGHLFEMVGP